LYSSKKEYEKAIEVSQKALKVDSTNVKVLTGLAITYDLLGEGEKAQDTYLRAIEANPDNVDLLFNLGRLYFMQGNYTDAIKYFDLVIAKDPEDYESNLNVGNAYLTMAEQFDKKVREVEEEKGEEMPDMRKQAKDYYRSAVPYLKKALDLKPDEVATWNNIGVAYIRSDDIEKGKEAFKKAEELGE
ncbi:tetratricopeptide repeat protein, partial [bacterium]|nr:tetratricopeptide repeat protein [bacterium]